MDPFWQTGSKVTTVNVNASSNSIGSMHPVHPELNDVPEHRDFGLETEAFQDGTGGGI